MSHINNKINNNTNNNINKNYGLEDNELIYSGIKKVFESDVLDDLVCMLSNYKYIIENKIDDLCEHEWVNDLIDIDLDTSKHICYCSKCEITKI